MVSFAAAINRDGSWEDKLMINPEMGLRLVINITGSEGENAVVTMNSPDQDALGGVRFLKERGFSKIGIIGHSEGGLIADKVANTGTLIDFWVNSSHFTKFKTRRLFRT